MLVLIDNYDSFTYNIVQVLSAAGEEVRVVRNDAATVATIASWSPDRLLVSPGPGTPADAGISTAAIRHFAGRIPVLGVCLGHQALATAFGGNIVAAPSLMHGKTSPIHHDRRELFASLPEPFEATRYHSLVVCKRSLPERFQVSAWTEDHTIMGLRDRPTGAEGVQFHPESILSTFGPQVLEAFSRS